MFYLDDASLGGSLEDVVNDVETVKRLAGDIGLVLNHHKTEVICTDSPTKDSAVAAFPLS